MKNNQQSNPMNQFDNAFVQGMLKQAQAIDTENEKRAYGARLTALLQRKGKLPAESKPSVGVSSFPTTKQANDELVAAVAEYLSKQSDETFLPWTLAKEWLGQKSEALGDLTNKATESLSRGMDNVRDTYDKVDDALFETPLERFIRHSGNNIDTFRQSPHGQELTKLLQGAGQTMKATPQIPHALIGAGAGGLAGALSGKSKNKETGEGGTRGRNALLGALLGGGAGAAFPTGQGLPQVNPGV